MLYEQLAYLIQHNTYSYSSLMNKLNIFLKTNKLSKDEYNVLVQMTQVQMEND